MRLLLVALLCATPAWAIDDCFAGDKPVNRSLWQPIEKCPLEGR